MKIGCFLYNMVVFEAEGGFDEGFLTQCLKEYISISQVEYTPFGFRAKIPAAQYQKLHKIARKHHSKIHIISKQGPFFRAKMLRQHRGILVGAFLFAILSICLRGLVWNIDYHSIPSSLQQDLSNRLFSYGIYQGAVVNKDLLDKATQSILLDTDGYAWLSLNFSKGKLIAEGQRTTPLPQLHLPESQNIYAAETGVVRTVEVYSGYSDIQAGQTVQKGELLVHAEAPGQNDTVIPCQCRAKIIAYIEQEHVICCPLQNSNIVSVESRQPDGIALYFFGRKIWLKARKDAQSIPFQQGIEICGFSFPMTIYRTFSVQTSKASRNFSEAEAQKRCRELLERLLYSKYPDIEILSREYSYSNTPNGVECRLKMSAYVDIARSDDMNFQESQKNVEN